jgi:hypothetical protein
MFTSCGESSLSKLLKELHGQNYELYKELPDQDNLTNKLHTLSMIPCRGTTMVNMVNALCDEILKEFFTKM